VWIGGVLAMRFGWRTAFVVMGIPGVVLAVLASRIRELHRPDPASIGGALRRWAAHGVPRIAYYASPAIAVSVLGLVVSWSLERTDSVSSDVAAAVFSVFVGAGIAWSIARLIPVAMKRGAQAGHVAATALEDFGTAAATVLHTPTLIWLFLGGAMVTFAVNGLIAWAATFMTRVHGFTVAEVGGRFGVWALLGGAAGALAGGRIGDWLQDRWAGGRVLASGLGFVLGGPVCVWLIRSNDARLLTPLIVATYFFYTWYNGPLAAVILDVVPTAVRSSVLGAFVFFSHIAGDALAPPLVGYLSDQTHDIRAAMLVLPAAGIAGGGVILVALKTIQRDMRRVAA
jgi:MFS family permease